MWPPFICAQDYVLGKEKRRECPNLRYVMEAPNTSEYEAFEKLCELAVLIQLMAKNPTASNKHVPRHPDVNSSNAYNVTDILEIHDSCQDIQSLSSEVQYMYRNFPHRYKDTLQFVVVPNYKHFPLYDFFVFHRNAASEFDIAAGYQCKKASNYPDENHKAKPEVGISIFIERKPKGGVTRGQVNHGWTMLIKDEIQELLGESFFAALPEDEN